MSEENTIKFSAGERIINKGYTAEKAYLILSGRVRVFLDKDTKLVTLAELTQGDIFGESALFNVGIYGAHVEALEDTTVELIKPGRFEERLEDCDPLIKKLFEMMINRLRKTNETLVDRETREFMDIDLI